MPPSAEQVQAAVAEAESLLELPGVAGVGEGATDAGSPCVLIMTAGPVDLDALPAEIGGIEVRVLDIGEQPTAFDHEAVPEVEVAPDVEPDCA